MGLALGEFLFVDAAFAVVIVVVEHQEISVCLCMYVSVYLSIYLFIYPPTYLSIYLSIYLRSYLSSYLPLSLSPCACVCLSVFDRTRYHKPTA